CNSVRKVPVTSAVQELLDTARKNAFNTSPESYVLESPQISGNPLCNSFFRDGVAKELEALGITTTQQRERFLTCHSLRHTFITLAQLSGISDVEIRALAGHKSEKVMKPLLGKNLEGGSLPLAPKPCGFSATPFCGGCLRNAPKTKGIPFGITQFKIRQSPTRFDIPRDASK
ncbi:MAG: site-specific integrase, partial [Treponema sp.]|nr:site-specific integrase [Treponema sp.]